MRLWKSIEELIIKIFWPWFKKYIWPKIVKHQEDIINYIIELIKRKIEEWRKRWRQRSEEANQKAEENEQRASEAKSEEEAETYRKIAQVWREAADQFREENEALKRKLDVISSEVKKEATEKFKHFEIDISFSGQTPELKIGDSSYALPELPLKGTDTKE